MTLPSVKPLSCFSVCLTCLECTVRQRGNGKVNWSSCVMTSGDQINPSVDLSCSCHNIARALNKTLFLFTSYSSYTRAFIPSCISLQIVSKVFFIYFFSSITPLLPADELGDRMKRHHSYTLVLLWVRVFTVRAAKQLNSWLPFFFFFLKECSLETLVHWGLSAFFRSTHHACFLSPLCPLLSSCQDVEHMLSHRLWSRWPWRGTKGFAGVTSSSPCGLPQPAPSSAQHAGLLSLPHLLPEH